MSAKLLLASGMEAAGRIVAAYVRKNVVSRNQLLSLISKVPAALKGMDQDLGAPAVKPRPAVPIRRSVTPDYIVCLEDGKQFKTLKRHLMHAYNLTPEQYRTKWGLPADYPMTAPNYASARSEMAKRIGLGKKVKRSRRKRDGRPTPRHG